MDLKKAMVIIKGDIVTSKIFSLNYDKNKNNYIVRYKNNINLPYYYSIFNLEFLTNPDRIEPNTCIYKVNNFELNNIKEIYRFKNKFGKYHYHIIFDNNIEKDYRDDEIKICESLLSNQNSKNLFNYFKEIANSIKIDNENILGQQFNKIVNIDSESVLSCYFEKFNVDNKFDNSDLLIFPFGCNTSQFNAVKNAINNKISIIEGPPGTGKTQTILNIIANLIIRNKTSQIVSNNNSAITNIEDKLKKYGLDFFLAKLGSNDNKKYFINNQKEIIDLEKYKNFNLIDLENELRKIQEKAYKTYVSESNLSIYQQELNDLIYEYNYFQDYLKNSNISIINLNNKNDNLVKIWNRIIDKKSIDFFDILLYTFIYKIGNFKFYKNDINIIINSLIQAIYDYKISELNDKLKKLESFIEDNKYDSKEYIDISMNYFMKFLSVKFNIERKKYNFEDIKKDYKSFLLDYPIILSTTYSSLNSFNPNIKFDYVIMDEASQIDIVTGALSLSTAYNAVIIGDECQLPNVVTDKEKNITNNIFKKYNIENYYLYTNSILSSIKKSISNIPICMLKEHYRCHPRIIGFCDKKFYNNNLIIMTKDKNEHDVIKIIKSNIGNHSRDKSNQREVDIIKDLLPTLSSKDIGIITPYNNQVSLIKKEIPDIEVNTIHKYQGREKDIIIISTVDDKISGFVDDPHILNVAISRAKKQLILITTGNEILNTNINDFINYCKYYNYEIIDSNIYSIFDYLYKQYTDSRIKKLNNSDKISIYDSENLMYKLIKEVIKNINNLSVICHQSLNMLLKNKDLLTNEELKYATNNLTHLDFLIYNNITKIPILAIEVDGYHYHKKGSKQKERDKIKDSILNKYNIPLLRFNTTGSNEKEILKNKLEEIMVKR